MSKGVIGASVDLEMKALIVVAVYAFLKIAGDFVKNPAVVLATRIFFGVGHLLFFVFFMQARSRITKSQGRPSEEKAKAMKACQLIFRSVMARAVIVGFIHVRTQMMPPLIISVFMAFFSLIENIDICYVVRSRFPGAFDAFF